MIGLSPLTRSGGMLMPSNVGRIRTLKVVSRILLTQFFTVWL